MLKKARIIGTGSAVPQRILTNKELEDIVDTSDKWITRRTGIKERRICSKKLGESTTVLAQQACLNAMEMAGVSPQSIDMIVIGTVTSDRMFPSTACMVQEALEIEDIPAFDVSAGCSGFIFALTVANNAIRCGTSKRILVVGVERLSSIVNWEDRGTCVLLADGAGAVVLDSTTEEEGILSTHIKSDGTAGKLLYSADGNPYTPEILQDILDKKPFHLKMDGHRLFKRAINCLTSIAKEAMEHNSLSSKDIALVVPHQANIRIIDFLARRLKLPMEQVVITIDKYGNTSASSIPIALDEAVRDGRIKKGNNVLMVAFGAGFTWGSVMMRWSI